MNKQYMNPSELSVPRFYSHAVSVEGSATVVFISGQVAWDANGKVVGTGEAWLTELSTAALRGVLALRPEAVAE